ncbi:pilus assembly protein TadG-related protein [Sphingobium sp. JS3065]|uniref:pilus assembly protein TadG-related protein n=1 Tax=Sphingobium sp. JS3065 TaxID=2970925 RepID=UPI002264DD75|nr:pilus assembly protein TadG-related protein [Sphingobium sp. JS3065]UZW55389.1 pilus assembly protein TadG-related protein [Sphingobium sp. JS3065]
MFGGSMGRLLRDRTGNVLMMAAASMPILIGAAGLATDTVQWTLWKRQVQRQADSAALAGAYAVAQGFSASDSATSDINRLSLITLSQTPTIENAPTAGAFAGNANAVRVVLQTTRELPFSKILGVKAPVIFGEATAAVLAEGDYCVVSLEKTSAVGITLQGNATVDLGCGIATNSRASNAVTAGGSSKVTATPVAAVGGLTSSTNYVSPTTLMPYSLPLSDPYAGLPAPTSANFTGCNNKYSVQPNQVVAQPLQPGCYKGLDIKGTLTLAPGTYFIDGGSFSVGSQAILSGSRVTIILTSRNASTNASQIASVDINGGAKLNLSAPDSGAYSGVLFYQDRLALDSGTNKINGNADSVLQGAFYFPSQAMEFSGTSGMQTKCVKMVSRRVTFIGNSQIVNECDNTGVNPIPASRVRLVG